MNSPSPKKENLNASENKLLQTYLYERDVECPRCGYNLRSGQSDVCPECGDRVQLGIELVEPKLGPYIALLLAASAGFAGSTGIGLLALSAGAFPDWFAEFSGKFLLGMVVLFGIMLYQVLRHRRRIRRLTEQTQRRAAWIAWAVLSVLSIIFMITFHT